MTDGAATGAGLMHLQVMMPTRVLFSGQVAKVVAESEDGHFCLLPRHADFVAAVVPGVLSFTGPDDQEQFVALDAGVLVKSGGEVTISTMNAVQGTDLRELEALVEEHFLELDEQERRARSALARLEAGALRGIRDLQERAHE